MRLRFLVEGQTEESFVNNVLVPHLWDRGIDARTAQKVTTSHRRGQVHKGGVTSYQRFIGELVRLLKEDPGAAITTMIDYYGLPGDFFPDNAPDSPESVETRIKHDAEEQIGSYPHRILPYVQLHEFETLLLSGPGEIGRYFGDVNAVDMLSREIAPFGDLEKVNDTPEGAPSKRIIRHFPAYARGKRTAGPMIAERIGLSVVREACQRFNRWVEQLESLR